MVEDGVFMLSYLFHFTPEGCPGDTERLSRSGFVEFCVLQGFQMIIDSWSRFLSFIPFLVDFASSPDSTISPTGLYCISSS